MKEKKVFTKFILPLIIILLVWSIITTIDYRRVVHNFEKPIFAIPTVTADDGGSGTYKGLGYSFVIKGNFMPEDEFLGVIHAKFYLFGKKINESLRD